MSAVLTWILSFLSGPVIKGLLDAYKAKLASVNTTDQHAVDLAVADLQAQIEARKAAVAVANTPVGSWVQAAFAVPVIVYLNKVIVWDKIWPGGATDPIEGQVGVWVSLIIGFYFGGMIASNVVGQIVGRFRK